MKRFQTSLSRSPFPVYPEAPKGQLLNENAQVIVNQMTAETLETLTTGNRGLETILNFESETVTIWTVLIIRYLLIHTPLLAQLEKNLTCPQSLKSSVDLNKTV